MLNNNKPKRKHQRNRPLTTKIKRLFVLAKGKYVHELYPEEYYMQFWFDHKDSEGIAVVVQLEVLTQKYVAHWMADVFFHFICSTMLTKKFNSNNRRKNHKNAYVEIWN